MSHALSAADLRELVDRVAPVMIFLVAITVVAEIADAAGVFDVAGHLAARLARGRTIVLWLLVVLLATVSTIVLSLDTTAVLLTPVVITMARQVGLDPTPFAMTTLWLANTASLLLPVSNLTNLLALHRFGQLHVAYSEYIATMAIPALVAVVATTVVLLAFHRRALRGGYRLADAPSAPDRVLLVVASAVCLGLGPVFLTGVLPAIPASAAAVLLVAAAVARRRSVLRQVHVPWPMVVGVCALFLVVDAAQQHGLDTALRTVAGGGTGGWALLRTAGIGAGAANLVNNLPAYLALEPVADGAVHRLAALLVGVDVGPLVTIWGSLATLLWRARCRRAGLQIGAGRLAAQGLCCAALAVVGSTAALALLG